MKKISRNRSQKGAGNKESPFPGLEPWDVEPMGDKSPNYNTDSSENKPGSAANVWKESGWPRNLLVSQ